MRAFVTACVYLGFGCVTAGLLGLLGFGLHFLIVLVWPVIVVPVAAGIFACVIGGYFAQQVAFGSGG